MRLFSGETIEGEVNLSYSLEGSLGEEENDVEFLFMVNPHLG